MEKEGSTLSGSLSCLEYHVPVKLWMQRQVKLFKICAIHYACELEHLNKKPKVVNPHFDFLFNLYHLCLNSLTPSIVFHVHLIDFFSLLLPHLGVLYLDLVKLADTVRAIEFYPVFHLLIMRDYVSDLCNRL